MTRLEDRQSLLATIREAQDAGSRLEPACAVAGIDARTIQRWQNEDRTVRDDGRPGAVHPPSAHALTEAERTRIVAVANQGDSVQPWAPLNDYRITARAILISLQ